MGGCSATDKNIVLYMHAGSGNHGCEAIVNSTCAMLQKSPTLISSRKEEDERYSLGKWCHILQEKRITANFWIHLFYLAKKILTRNPMCYITYRYGEVLQEKRYDLAVSVGGDNYCYPDQVEDLILLNQAFHKKGMETVLWGASVEPSLLERADVVADMKLYKAIFAREKETYQALEKAGISKEKLHLYPDPAFTLSWKEDPFPEGIQEDNLIGINVSLMVIEKESKKGIVLENYRYLIERLLQETDLQIVLIPHVIWENNDDRKALGILYESYENNSRVCLLEDHDCMTLKGYIKRMRFLVAARTHASIAAYSTGVPTLVTGYSIKAKGIAEALFGTQEHYVVPVQEMEKKEDLWKECQWLMSHENQIREHLAKVIPGYIEEAKKAGNILNEIIKN